MFERLRLLRSAIAIVRDPKKLDQVFSVADALAARSDLSAMIAAIAASSPTAAAAFRDRPRVTDVSLTSLSSRPAGSLGRAFADHCTGNRLDPEVFLGRSASTDAEYMLAHLYETHDIWHAVTGFATDVAGEGGLQAFYLAQFPGKLAMMLLPLGLLNAALYAEDDYANRIEAISVGWRAGQVALPLFGIDWASQWDRPLSDIRDELGIGYQAIGALAA